MNLKISNITNLQDARYCAAMGVDFISFNLERGNPRKLETPMVWNLSNWLEGLEYILETDSNSLEEALKVRESMDARYISLPVEAWDSQLLEKFPSLILRAESFHDPLKLIDKVNKAQSQNREIKLEIQLSSWENLQPFEDILPHLFLNFTDLSLVNQLIEHSSFQPFGISFQQEVEEKEGMLNFDLLDEILIKLGRGNEQVIE